MSPETVALKAWTNLRARSALLGIQAFRSDPADGPICYFSVNHGVARQYVDMPALRARIEDLEGEAQIEHRLFSFITMNWRGRPLSSHEVIVNLIASTKTRSGLSVRAELDNAHYPKGVLVSDKEFEAINIERNEFHGDWNYCIRPGEE